MPPKKYLQYDLRLPIRVTVVSIFIFATVVTAALAVSLQYHFSKSMATESAIKNFDDLAESTSRFLKATDNRASESALFLSNHSELIQGRWVNDNINELFASILRSSPMLYAIYIGLDNGDFYELINLNSSDLVRKKYNATNADRWIVITVKENDEERIKTTNFYLPGFELRETIEEPSDYNASLRPWFSQAIGGEVRKTAPYLFQHLQAPGQTYSIRIPGGVIAVDIALSSISNFLSTRSAQEYGEVFIYRDTGELIASNQKYSNHIQLPKLQPLDLSFKEHQLVMSQGKVRVSNEMDWTPIDFSVSGEPMGYSIDFLKLVSQLTGIEFQYVNGYEWSELVNLYKNNAIDILQPLFKNNIDEYPGEFSLDFLELPYSLVTTSNRKSIKTVDQMLGLSVAIPEGWSIIPYIRKHFPQIQVVEVKSSREVFEVVANGRVDAGLDIGEILHQTAKNYFFENIRLHENIDFSPLELPNRLHFLVSEELVPLLPLFNRAIKVINSGPNEVLANKWLHGSDNLSGMQNVPYPELVNEVKKINNNKIFLSRKINKKTSYIYIAPFSFHNGKNDYIGIVIPERIVLSPSIKRVRISIGLTIVYLLLLLPAPWLFSSPIVRPIRRLAEENEKISQRKKEKISVPHTYIKEIDELGQSMAAMVDSIHEHEKKQVALLDSFIQLIAQAIDDKSHYTAGHCARVPELAFMLAHKAQNSQAPAFKEFGFKSENEWREFRVAAWLHDCGKITTPEHIVDKGSKLETIYNRIHEIRMRFEVLWRDAEITFLKSSSQEPDEVDKYKKRLEENRKKLQEDFAFVAKMNIGGEFLTEDKKQRLHEISNIEWQRHFSEKLGLSPLEESRFGLDDVELPCMEKLLSDKPNHIIHRENPVNYDAKLGIKVEVPEHLYNLGELYNLTVERGTLTREDRFKINEHIISTIRMLDTLPFTNELSRVPRYASTHHETMKGTGYPRRLEGKDLSVPERILVLADIFEALTAADRPYKKAKPLSVAIDILFKMVQDEHIDVDVFELFLVSGVFMEYAKIFLPPEQIDCVEVKQYLRNGV